MDSNIKWTVSELRDPVLIPEVLENLFRYLNVDSLKKCRFVHRIWNEEACRALKRRSHLCLHEGAVKANQALLELIRRGKSQELPSPFKRLFVSIESFSSKLMKKLLRQEATSVVELYLNQAPSTNNSEFQKSLHKILVENSGTLKYLRVAVKSGVNLGISGFSAFSLHLPRLIDFGFWEISSGSEQTDNTDFLIKIINSSPNLQKLCSSCSVPAVLHNILLKCNLSSLESLYAESVTAIHIKELSRINIPQLRSLILQADVDSIPDEHRVSSDVLQNMVKNFSATLEELNVSWISSTEDENFPICPKLKTLNLYGWDGSLGIFDPHTLRALNTITITNHFEMEDSILNPHEGVRSLTIESTHGIEPIGLRTNEEIDYLMVYCHHQYPNLIHLDLTMAVNDEVIRSVIRNFPALESFTLDTTSCVSSHIFTGRNKLACERFLAEGYDLTEIAIMPSLRDLPHLEKLIVGRYTRSSYPDGFRISDHIIRYGIAEITSLRIFQLNWNPELSVQEFVGCLSHLEQIIINNSSDSSIEDSARKLQCALPQVQLQSNAIA